MEEKTEEKEYEFTTFDSEHQKLAEISFKTVMEANVHQDNKANRIVSAMAFLTTAMATVFTKIYNFEKYPFDATLISFSLFVLFIVLGTACYLNALGPSFNLAGFRKLKEEKTDPKPDKIRIPSIIFFQKLAEVDQKTFVDHWKQDPKSLVNEITRNYIYETYFVAEKIKTKVAHMQLGSIFYKAALSTVPSYLSTIYVKIEGRQSNWAFSLGSLFLGFCILFFIVSYEALQPNNDVKDGEPVAKPKSNYLFLLILVFVSFIASIFFFTLGYSGRV
jgi:hypothetical protein